MLLFNQFETNPTNFDSHALFPFWNKISNVTEKQVNFFYIIRKKNVNASKVNA